MIQAMTKEEVKVTGREGRGTEPTAKENTNGK